MSDIVTHIKAQEEVWITAHLSQDIDRFAALLHDHFVYSSERGVFDKETYVANLVAGTIQMYMLTNKTLHIIDHDDTVITYGIAVLKASFQGQDISGQDRFTRIWKRFGTAWKAIALHADTIPPTDT